jgi:hypothetical protein
MEQIKIGDPIEFDSVGYVRLPDGAVVTSGRSYIVRQEGPHAFVTTAGDEREFEGVNPDKPADEGDDESDDYNDWKVATLREELTARDLPTSGNKPDLVARLLEDDANSEG